MNQFAAFVLAGGAAALANILSRIFFDVFASYELSILLGYLVGVTVAFLLNRQFVFREAAGPASRQYMRFALVNVLSFLQVWVVSMGVARLFFPAIGFRWNADTIAHVIGVMSSVVNSYLLHKHFSFRSAKASR